MLTFYAVNMLLIISCKLNWLFGGFWCLDVTDELKFNSESLVFIWTKYNFLNTKWIIPLSNLSSDPTSGRQSSENVTSI